MSKGNGKRKLQVVREKSAAQLEAEAKARVMDAQYVKWIRLTANDAQILELRDELREWRKNSEHNFAQHERLQMEYLTMQRFVAYVLNALAKEVGDDGDGITLAIEEENLNDIGGKHLTIALNENKTGWMLELKDGDGTSPEQV